MRPLVGGSDDLPTRGREGGAGVVVLVLTLNIFFESVVYSTDGKVTNIFFYMFGFTVFRLLFIQMNCYGCF